MSAVNNAVWPPVGTDDTYQYSVTTLSVYWPQTEHRRLIEQWPHLASEAGATWDEHRHQIKRHCALVERAGHKVTQASGNGSDFAAFLVERHVTRPSRSDLPAYPDLRTHPTLVSRPPARTDPCWCGSGRKYKRCRRPHGLGSAG